MDEYNTYIVKYQWVEDDSDEKHIITKLPREEFETLLKKALEVTDPKQYTPDGFCAVIDYLEQHGCIIAEVPWKHDMEYYVEEHSEGFYINKKETDIKWQTLT